jgi:uncharacterized membrane protein
VIVGDKKMSVPELNRESPAFSPAPGTWRGLTVVALLFNFIGVLGSCALALSATTMTNMASVIIYLPALAVELLFLLPLTLIAAARDRSLAARVLLLVTLVGCLVLAAVGTTVNLTNGAKW